MENKEYWSVKISQLASDLEDEVAYWLFENGASGVQQDLCFSQTDKKYLPKIQNQDFIDLVAYFESEPPEGLLGQFKESFPGTDPICEKNLSLDWQKEWKKDWRPFCLVSTYWVVPSWLLKDFNRPEAQKIIIDPGMAFGTGTHATTQLASQLIFEATGMRTFEKSVDVGTGSGILGILMEKLGWPSISAYDNDEHAERVFLENLEVNQCRALKWDPYWFQGKTYDGIVANIIDGVLLDLKPEFQKCLNVGGHLILTGILKERESDFLKEMESGWGLERLSALSKDEWVGFHYRRLS